MVSLLHGNLNISKAVFGTSRLGGTLEHADPHQALSILHEAFEAGVTTYDTSDIYAQGGAERLLAEAFSRQRDEVIYATKGGYALSLKAKVLAKMKPWIRPLLKKRPVLATAVGRRRGTMMQRNFSASYLTKAVEGSLRRLKTDRIDVYQLHSPSSSDLDADEPFEALMKLKIEGKIRAYGVSLLECSDISFCSGRGVSWVQVPTYFPSVEPDSELREIASRENILLVARQAFGSGLLSKNIDEWSQDSFLGDAAVMEKAKEAMGYIKCVGDPHSVMLRYLYHQSNYDSFLFATTKLPHLRKNLSAFALPPLTEDVLSALYRLFQAINDKDL